MEIIRVVPNEKTRKKKIENGDRHRDNLGKSTIFSFRTELQKHAKTVTVTISLLMKTPFSFRTKLWKSTKTVTMISSKHFNESSELHEKYLEAQQFTNSRHTLQRWLSVRGSSD